MSVEISEFYCDESKCFEEIDESAEELDTGYLSDNESMKVGKKPKTNDYEKKNEEERETTRTRNENGL